ncbi:hypothetical protein BSKO_12232 [Bryopsis sp. KO-2023]|nr:hypothetical protein BSKO_12232 [Bryopsis sp. KO-2023]
MWSSKSTLWLSWAINAVLSFLFIVLGGHSFGNVQDFRNADWLDGNDDNTKRVRLSLFGVLAALFLSIVVLLVYNIFTFLVILGRWISAKLMGGFGHGVILTASIYTAAFMLLTALILHSQDDTMKWGLKDKAEKNAYKGAFAFAYILVGTYTIMFAAFIMCRTAFREAPEEKPNPNPNPNFSASV